MNVSIFGLGYVGTVCAGCLVSRSQTVVGVDVNPGKVDLMNAGQVSIVEREVPELFAAGHTHGRLSARGYGVRGRTATILEPTTELRGDEWS